jgi:hypothetical protein
VIDRPAAGLSIRHSTGDPSHATLDNARYDNRRGMVGRS